jgi:NAD+ diphosphatase
MMKYCPQCAHELVDKKIDSVSRKVCSAPQCGFVFWDNPVPVVAAVVVYQDQVLLARNAQWPAGVFSMITGYLEKNETPEQAVRREVAEELGLEGKSTALIGHYSLFKKNQLIIAYSVQASGRIQLNHEIAEVKLVDKASLHPDQFGKLQVTARVFEDWLSDGR